MSKKKKNLKQLLPVACSQPSRVRPPSSPLGLLVTVVSNPRRAAFRPSPRGATSSHCLHRSTEQPPSLPPHEEPPSQLPTLRVEPPSSLLCCLPSC
ncbi:hypothetical protein DAI22_03g225100 [Oryza sativa Japonica Group]|nr:hypothetical protein DAI22_03g225100 [Oryza sativa Japonica Group]